LLGSDNLRIEYTNHQVANASFRHSVGIEIPLAIDVAPDINGNFLRLKNEFQTP
jgi:hypothetical protein